jgi:TM2 domain-containing membrane protein YozV
VGAIYCEPCIAARLQGTPGTPQPMAVPLAAVPNAPSPGVAMLLGFIPGVGAMYNGQFLKAFVHVVVFVLLIMAASSVHGAFGILIPFWIFYMAFEAYKTAQAKMLGLPAPDPLGLDKLFGIQESQAATAAPFVTGTTGTAPVMGAVAPPPPMNPGEQPVSATPAVPENQAPVGAIVLIALGALFLLGNIGWFNLHRMWPVILIALGLWIAYKHMAQGA